jgi:uracil phosphoribosyltransferase
MAVETVCHPLAQHLLTILRNNETTPEEFRRATSSLSILLALQAGRRIECKELKVATPLEETAGSALAQSVALVPILRAGMAMVEPIAALFPDVSVGYIGLERHHETAIAHSYYCKLPDLAGRLALCLDPMLATGGSASQAISFMKEHGATDIKMVCIVAAPEGVAKMTADHPDVDIVAVAVDRGLNDLKYILPGVGDFGDRLYGTL